MSEPLTAEEIAAIPDMLPESAPYLWALIRRLLATLDAARQPTVDVEALREALREAIDYMPALTVSQRARRIRWERALAAQETPERLGSDE